jgi:hypothetical protein
MVEVSPRVERRLAGAAAGWLLALGTILATATIALASCPHERTIHCASFSYRVHGHRYKPSHISFSLNGQTACRHAQALIRTWLASQTDRIHDSYDPSFKGYWFKTANNPLEFAAGLCGDLKFRK